MNQHTLTTATNHTTPSPTVEGMKRMIEEIRSLHSYWSVSHDQ